MEKYVVTISRQFGSLGRTIAQRLSEELNIEFWDRDIVEATAKRMGRSIKTISDEEESSKGFFLRKKYCPEVNSVFDHKDLMIDSSKLGVDGAVDLIAHVVRNRCRQFHILPGKNRIPKSWR